MTDKTTSDDHAFPIIALCASAGGLEAFEAFFEEDEGVNRQGVRASQLFLWKSLNARQIAELDRILLVITEISDADSS